MQQAVRKTHAYIKAFNLTKFSSDKKRKSPYNTIAAKKCEGKTPLNIDEQGENVMSRNNSNQINVPEAKEAMNRFKMECANDVDFQNHIKKNNFLE